MHSSSPRDWQLVSSTSAGGSPKSAGGCESRPPVQSQRTGSRSYPGRAFTCTTARPGATSRGISSVIVLNFVTPTVSCS
ncbi:MAG: hypothetical protein E6G00_04090 [Actinobacteria bacterium]|nr:MAG: hypothetical protein E6G00_04090 [Actinomycetota bacterium]